jgi:glycosyltransferase involved in cell wall biosynthesis
MVEEEMKDKTAPILSIIVPAYNAEKTLHRCIESILDQQHSAEIEIIISNDGSTDNTSAVAEEYREFQNVVIITEKMLFRSFHCFADLLDSHINASFHQDLCRGDIDDETVFQSIEGKISCIFIKDDAAYSVSLIYRWDGVISKGARRL